ncbi:hypothetical protein SGPA1_40324 [Streptomyces misionensis JCM 4497]
MALSSPAMSLSRVLLPEPLGATRPVRPLVTVKDRSWKTGVSSGQAKERCEQTTAASDMKETSKMRGQGCVNLCPGQTWGNGYDEADHLGGAPEHRPVAVRSGSHPEMSSSPTTSATPHSHSSGRAQLSKGPGNRSSRRP